MASDDECRRIRMLCAWKRHPYPFEMSLFACEYPSGKESMRYTHMWPGRTTHMLTVLHQWKKRLHSTKRRVDKNNVANTTLWTTLKNEVKNVVWEMALPLSYDFHLFLTTAFLGYFRCDSGLFVYFICEQTFLLIAIFDLLWVLKYFLH